jgi:hypothetical protein
MKITRTSKQTERLENLEVGTVFALPNESSIYMVINEHDYYFDYEKLDENEIAFIDLENGEILVDDCDTEVILVNGSFVVSDD